ncbi:MAG: hypothetical protein V9E96_13450 [Chitinophagaceae bacterium]
MHKLCKGKVPHFHNELIDDIDKQLITDIAAAKTKVENLLELYKFREAQFEVMDLARKGNQYMQKKEPWIVAKSLTENPENQKLIDNCLHLVFTVNCKLSQF